MSVSKKYIIPILFTFFFLISIPSVFAVPPTNTREIVNETVTWTIADGQCPSLPAGLSVFGTGERHQIINTRVNADGSSRIIVNDVVRGSAVDSNGDTYHFIYANHSTTSVPSGSGIPVHIEMTDSFVLNGHGAAGHLAVGFRIRWSTFDPSDPTWPPPNVEIVNMRGDAFLCDPI